MKKKKSAEQSWFSLAHFGLLLLPKPLCSLPGARALPPPAAEGPAPRSSSGGGSPQPRPLAPGARTHPHPPPRATAAPPAQPGCGCCPPSPRPWAFLWGSTTSNLKQGCQQPRSHPQPGYYRAGTQSPAVPLLPVAHARRWLPTLVLRPRSAGAAYLAASMRGCSSGDKPCRATQGH